MSAESSGKRPMRHFDADCLLGVPKIPLPDVVPDLADLRAEMARLGIERALVRHRACLDADAETGNELLLAEIGACPELIPAWYVLPFGTGDTVDPPAAVDRMAALGVRAAWSAGPGAGALCTLEPWVAGSLLAALERHRIPLWLAYDAFPPATVRDILDGYPRLPVILAALPRVGRNPLLYALMARTSRLYLCVSAVYSVHLGLEDLVTQFGADRLLFGSGYPTCEGGASIAHLTFAQLDESVLRAIAYDNLDRLLGEVIA